MYQYISFAYQCSGHGYCDCFRKEAAEFDGLRRMPRMLAYGVIDD